MKKPPGFASWPLHLQQAWLKSQAARPSQAPARPAAAPQPSAKAESDQQDQAEEAEVNGVFGEEPNFALAIWSCRLMSTWCQISFMEFAKEYGGQKSRPALDMNMVLA